MSFFASLVWFSLVPERMALIWAVAAVLACVLFFGIRFLRRAGLARASTMMSITVAVPLLALASIIEFEFWRLMSLPIQVGLPSIQGGDGMSTDNDGAIRLLVAVAAFCLPFVLLGCLAVIAAWIVSMSRDRPITEEQR